MKNYIGKKVLVRGIQSGVYFGECGYLFDDYVMADIERERNEWIIDIRQMMRFLYKCSYNDLNTIREILKKASEKMNG